MEAKLEPSSEYLNRSAAHTRHGHTKGRQYTPTYYSWQAMLARCRYVARDVEQKHAARGISVCDRWQSFDVFLTDMGERPEGMTLDRHPNPDGNYEPGNCRWATPIEQARNRRNAKLNYEQALEVCLAVLRGEPAAAVARRYGLSASLPREIVKGRSWPDASAAAHAQWSRENG